MGKEIESKFLVKNNNEHVGVNCNIKQGYILTKKNKQVRIRITDDTLAELGIKFTSDEKDTRDEYEYEIPIEDAVEIYDKCKNTIEKKRLSFNDGVYHYDIDTFPNGIVFVEVEFNSLDDRDKWIKPDWIGEDISKVKKYSNIEISKQNLKF